MQRGHAGKLKATNQHRTVGYRDAEGAEYAVQGLQKNCRSDLVQSVDMLS